MMAFSGDGFSGLIVPLDTRMKFDARDRVWQLVFSSQSQPGGAVRKK
jgi:hypothetical protein